MMTSAQIRQSFLDFFHSKGHAIVPSSSLLPDSPNLLFTNAGMNQFVPIFLGEKKCAHSPGRVADTQKCIRAGGKHNDLEDVGLDTYHHTFFEMLGNWSFGDYFKAEAIDWAWELITRVWGFPPRRLYATVYAPDKSKGDPADFDQEAWTAWAEKFRAAGLDPAVHIINGNRKDNFWMMGETGPCGPCTELHVDLTPGGDTAGRFVNAGHASCIEIWNLVFIQFNANADGTFAPLPARHVDTGMGFERVTSIIQCTQGFTRFDGVISNYETDIFRPIFDTLGLLSGKRYASTLPAGSSQGATAQEREDVAFRVIADHIRTLTFAIADGIQPGNTDRNYVLRRILRRAVRYGRTLGFNEPFFYKLVDVLVRTMGGTFPEIRLRARHVQDVIRAEEETFNRTLDRGMELFETEVSRPGTPKALPGDFAFKLYDTYGFPLDLTQLLARERGLEVDTTAFERLMGEQRTRAKAAQKREVIEIASIATTTPTRFVGHEQRTCLATILEVVRIKGGAWALVFDQTPFYAEMGGQIGDSGFCELGARHEPETFAFINTQKVGEVFLHVIDKDCTNPPTPEILGKQVRLQVNTNRRAAIERHHTATHLLHWALHKTAGRGIAQKGSSVNDLRLTFDFNSAALTPAQIRATEALVNVRIRENAPVTWTEIPHASVKDRADIMQFFTDKYGDTVRVVQIGGGAGELNGYSMELCGGTHVSRTGEIGSFRILSENAIAAGTRRIEAIAGEVAEQHAHADTEILRHLATTLATTTGELVAKTTQLLAQVHAQEKKLRALHQREQDAYAVTLASQCTNATGLRTVIHKATLPLETPARLRELANAVAQHADMVILGAEIDGKASVVCQCAPAAVKAGHNAGKIIAAICAQLEGKGGGKPDFAMGGGANPRALDETLAKLTL
jgi:alanyl-tRNA synthetase